jgi:hypothetical protein
MAEILPCPDPTCRAPAEILDRWVWPSTNGPVEHVKTRCLNGHCFTPPVDSLVGWPIAKPQQALGTGA